MSKKIVKFLTLWLLIAVLIFVCACQPDNGKFTDNGDIHDLTKRDASSVNGVSTAGAAYASQAGLEILRAGGNAFDAATAIGFALGVVEPYASGVGGGDGQMIGYNASTDEVVYYNFPSWAPAKASIETVVDGRKIYEDYTSDMKTGVTSVGVPMSVAFLLDMLEKYGSGNITRQQALEYSIKLAREGYEVNSVTAANFASAYENFSQLRTEECGEAAEIYCNPELGVGAPMIGDIIVNENYAKVLDSIAENGKAGFYDGWVADAIVTAMTEQKNKTQNKPGVLSKEDLLYAMNEYDMQDTTYGVIHTDYTAQATGETYDVYANALASGGIIFLETLNMIEHYAITRQTPISSLGYDNAEYLHVLAQSMHFAFSDKKAYIGDARHISMPLNGLISKDYAAARFEGAFKDNDTFKANNLNDYGELNGADPWKFNGGVGNVTYYQQEGDLEYPGTTSFSVSDKYGNVVCVTQTLDTYWGSYVMPKGTGFFLNNAMTNFNIMKTENPYANSMAPYRQTASYIGPVLIMKAGVPYMVVGSAGSEKIPIAELQVFLNVAEFGMTMQQAVDASRLCNFTVSVHDFDDIKGYEWTDHKYLNIETADFSPETIAALEAKNYYIHPYKTINQKLGGVQAILMEYDENGNLINQHGGADSRRGGKALAY